MYKLIGIAILSYLGSLVMFSAEFWAIGIKIQIPSLFLYTSFVTTSVLISLTPGAIGIRETILLVTSVTIGINTSQILNLALLDRAVNFSLLFLLFSLSRSRKFRKLITGRDVDI